MPFRRATPARAGIVARPEGLASTCSTLQRGPEATGSRNPACSLAFRGPVVSTNPTRNRVFAGRRHARQTVRAIHVGGCRVHFRAGAAVVRMRDGYPPPNRGSGPWSTSMMLTDGRDSALKLRNTSCDHGPEGLAPVPSSRSREALAARLTESRPASRANATWPRNCPLKRGTSGSRHAWRPLAPRSPSSIASASDLETRPRFRRRHLHAGAETRISRATASSRSAPSPTALVASQTRLRVSVPPYRNLSCNLSSFSAPGHNSANG